MDKISKKNVLEETIVFYFIIEFQKCGLFHAHILLWLKAKVNNCDLVGRVICAEILDLDRQPQLYANVAKHMMHGPCGLDNAYCSCMEDEKCSKHYPMQTQDTTKMDGNGHVLYCHQNYSWYVEKCTRGQTVRLDN